MDSCRNCDGKGIVDMSKEAPCTACVTGKGVRQHRVSCRLPCLAKGCDQGKCRACHGLKSVLRPHARPCPAGCDGGAPLAYQPPKASLLVWVVSLVALSSTFRFVSAQVDCSMCVKGQCIRCSDQFTDAGCEWCNSGRCMNCDGQGVLTMDVPGKCEACAAGATPHSEMWEIIPLAAPVQLLCAALAPPVVISFLLGLCLKCKGAGKGPISSEVVVPGPFSGTSPAVCAMVASGLDYGPLKGLCFLIHKGMAVSAPAFVPDNPFSAVLAFLANGQAVLVFRLHSAKNTDPPVTCRGTFEGLRFHVPGIPLYDSLGGVWDGEFYGIKDSQG
eukprot:gene1738-2902_t